MNKQEFKKQVAYPIKVQNLGQLQWNKTGWEAPPSPHKIMLLFRLIVFKNNNNNWYY